MESIVLCGGESKRMKPYLPFNKPLAEIGGGRLLVEYQVDWLRSHDVDHVVLAIDKETYEGLRVLRPGLLDFVDCSVEDVRLGTGGAVVKALELLDSSRFYLMNVDDIILSDGYGPGDLLSVLDGFDGALGSVLLGRARFPFGVVETRSSRVVGFRQKPILDFRVCAGHYAFTVEGVERYFPSRGNFEDGALQRMARDGVLYSLDLEGEWITVNNVKQLEAARRRLEGLC